MIPYGRHGCRLCARYPSGTGAEAGGDGIGAAVAVEQAPDARGVGRGVLDLLPLASSCSPEGENRVGGPQAGSEVDLEPVAPRRRRENLLFPNYSSKLNRIAPEKCLDLGSSGGCAEMIPFRHKWLRHLFGIVIQQVGGIKKLSEPFRTESTY